MRMPALKHLVSGVLFLSATLFMTACSKEDRDGKSRIQIALTDAPGDFKAVYIDVREVSVSYDNSGDSSWRTLPDVKAGIYNLLTLVNGKDTVLADADIASGTLKEIRLVLGDNNWVVTNTGDSVKLETPSGQSSGIKLKINLGVYESMLYRFVLDFDVAKSIHPAGNSGKYILNPVIRTVVEGQGGDIRGAVQPAELPSAVLVLNGTDTVASTYTDASGGYFLKEIRPGSYTLHYIPVDPTLQPVTKEGVVVELDKETTIETITLTH